LVEIVEVTGNSILYVKKIDNKTQIGEIAHRINKNSEENQEKQYKGITCFSALA